jgi:hypothetical protein
MSNNTLLSVNLKSFGKFGYCIRATRTCAGKLVSDYAFTLKYPIYHFELGDVDRDGKTDILLGVIKTTRFHPEMQKRLFIYKIDEGRIRPMWMGSHINHEIVDFRYIKRPGLSLIRAVEKINNTQYILSEYQWKGFGLSLIRNISGTLEKNTAYAKFNQ